MHISKDKCYMPTLCETAFSYTVTLARGLYVCLTLQRQEIVKTMSTQTCMQDTLTNTVNEGTCLQDLFCISDAFSSELSDKMRDVSNISNIPLYTSV